MKAKLLLSGLLVFAFVSCKKCYTCERIDYCIKCETRNADGSIWDTYPESCSWDISTAENEESAYINSFGGNGRTASCTRSRKIDDVKEACGKVDRDIAVIESYTCADK